jgi:hypothetical protein
MVDVECQICGKKFTAFQKTKLYCSTGCSNQRRYGKAKLRKAGISTGTRGAISEVVVCADLMERGMEVFRAVSPACSCDLAILNNAGLLRVEVRTGYRDLITGKINAQRNHNADILAICVNGEEVIYEPPI